MKKIILLISLLILSPNNVSGDIIEIYTVNQLDEYRGYCIDIKGHKLKAKITKGLQAHTCYSYQGQIAVDQSFDSFRIAENEFFLPEFDVCMEASSMVASNPIKLGKCTGNELQQFKWDVEGRIHLMGNSKLCLTVDKDQAKKGRGGSPVHLRRPLTLELCRSDLAPYQIWGYRSID